MIMIREEMTRSAQVVIAGGGPAGLASAIRLCQLGYQPLIIDRPRQPADRKIGESLAPSAWAVIQRLGISHIVNDSRHLACPGHRSSWGLNGRLISKDFLFEPYGQGWHLDRIRFEIDLRNHAESLGCQFTDQPIHRLTASESGIWTLWLESLTTPLQAKFLIDATGRPSMIAHAAGARKQKVDQLVAWYGFLKPTSKPIRDATGLIEARPEGWWYSGLLPDGWLVIAFLTDPDLLPVKNLHSPEEWQNWLEQSVHTRQQVRESKYCLSGYPAVAPAGSAVLDTIYGPNWVACGDAAASYDPLSSHGIATAIASGFDAAEAIHDLSCGNSQPLENYSNRIKNSFKLYKTIRTEFYAQEDRWPDSAFWQRRNGSGFSVPDD